MSSGSIHPASFRDPAGFVYERNGKYLRQVNQVYAEHYSQLMDSGLYNELAGKRMLLTHTESNDDAQESSTAFKVLEPEQLTFITYPYEWCFGQLKDAALLTISLAHECLERDMVLKDATPFNIQFVDGLPVWIDTLSFEKFTGKEPWVAYRQFCNYFLFPLYLAHYKTIEPRRILQAWPDGIGAADTWKLLPGKTALKFHVLMHVYLQKSVSRKKSKTGKVSFNQPKMLRLLWSLEQAVEKIKAPRARSAWSDYYTSTVIGQEYVKLKEAVLKQIISGEELNNVLDLGCNNGHFSLLLADYAKQVIATDSDEPSINSLYEQIKELEVRNLLPLVTDVANPPGASGFRHAERAAFHDRIKTETVSALALIHHLRISANIPLQLLASWFSEISDMLIIEWVPKTDEKVQELLSNRRDIFEDYTQDQFESLFALHFNISKKLAIGTTGRYIYLMKKR